MTNAHSETGQMAVCCQILTLGALISRSALSFLFGALFKKFGLFLNTPRRILKSLISYYITVTDNVKRVGFTAITVVFLKVQCIKTVTPQYLS